MYAECCTMLLLVTVHCRHKQVTPLKLTLINTFVSSAVTRPFTGVESTHYNTFLDS